MIRTIDSLSREDFSPPLSFLLPGTIAKKVQSGEDDWTSDRARPCDFSIREGQRLQPVSVTWRFDEHGIWVDPIIYETPTAEDVVSLHYFTT